MESPPVVAESILRSWEVFPIELKTGGRTRDEQVSFDND